MSQSAELQKLGIQQIILLNSFSRIKVETLDMMISNYDNYRVEQVRAQFEQIERALETVLANLKPREGEGKSASELRRRGTNVLFSQAKQEIKNARNMVLKLSLSLPLDMYPEKSRNTISEAINGLLDIVDASSYLIGEKA